MKKILILITIFFLSFGNAFSNFFIETKLSEEIQESVKRQVSIAFNKYVSKTESKYYDWWQADFYIKKVDAFLLSYNKDDEIAYAVWYLNILFKEYVFNYIEKCFRGGDWKCYDYNTVVDIKTYINFYTKDDNEYSKMLDILFLKYFMNSFDSKGDNTYNWFWAWLKELENHKDYDNYDFFVWRYYLYKNKMDENFVKNKDSTFYRKDLYVPSIISEECLWNPTHCIY